jgi:nucleoside-diphosphate-sugar epimerase
LRHSVVTGAAGFIGSHLCERLLAAGQQVRGLDAFTDYYPRRHKDDNVAPLIGREGFELIEGDLEDVELESLLEGADAVYHLAGQPGVRSSWGEGFESYVRRNVVATQRLLEACRRHPIEKLVFASSSSVYGDSQSFPTPESAYPRPISPYGVTKLAAEHLCELYRSVHGVPVTSLRLFTVYGPRQRPDMAFARIVQCAIDDEPFELYGDGQQTRDITYVGDVVTAMQSAASSSWCGIANVGGGLRVSMNEVLDTVESLCGPLQVHRRPASPGDARHTGADTRVAREMLGFRPLTPLRDGLAEMLEWERGARAVSA